MTLHAGVLSVTSIEISSSAQNFSHCRCTGEVDVNASSMQRHREARASSNSRKFQPRPIAKLLSFILGASVSLLCNAQNIAEQLNAGRLDLIRARAGDSQASALVNTIIGRSDLNAFMSGLQHATVAVPSEHLQTVKASKWLLEAARNSRVLMFNENHYEPQARVFVRSLLPELRRAGFTHIGLEAFQPSSVPNAYQSSAGYYTVEPTFAALMAEATSLSFVVFGYEATQFADHSASIEEMIAAREKSEAENLRAAVGSFPQNARVVIFAGWSHIAEKPLDDGLGPSKTRWMAARFFEETNIDPFTVDLATCTREVRDSEDRDGVVYLQADGSPFVTGGYKAVVDAQVCLPVLDACEDVSCQASRECP